MLEFDEYRPILRGRDSQIKVTELLVEPLGINKAVLVILN